MEEDGEHGAHALHPHGKACELGRQSLFDLGAKGFQMGVHGVVQPLQRGKSGGAGQGISGKGSGLVDGSEGRQLLHQFATASKGGQRQAAAGDFAHGDEVGR